MATTPQDTTTEIADWLEERRRRSPGDPAQLTDAPGAAQEAAELRVRSTPSSALFCVFCGTCLRGSGLCGNNGTHAYRSTLRADAAGNIQGISGAVLVPPLSRGA